MTATEILEIAADASNLVDIEEINRPVWDAAAEGCVPTEMVVLHFESRPEAQAAARALSAAGVRVGYERETAINAIAN